MNEGVGDRQRKEQRGDQIEKGREEGVEPFYAMNEEAGCGGK
jgi:hypothetical protein